MGDRTRSQSGLTLFRMEFLGAAHRWGAGRKKDPLPKICYTYLAMMKLDTVIPDVREIQKIYEPCDRPLDLC